MISTRRSAAGRSGAAVFATGRPSVAVVGGAGRVPPAVVAVPGHAVEREGGGPRRREHHRRVAAVAREQGLADRQAVDVDDGLAGGLHELGDAPQEPALPGAEAVVLAAGALRAHVIAGVGPVSY